MGKGIESLVERQVQQWREEARAGHAPTPNTSGQCPTICLSRERGAHGAAVARAVAERLHFTVYSHDLVQEIAARAYVSDRLVDSLDERARDAVDTWVENLLHGGGFTASDYLRNLTRVVATVSRHGRGIIIGRDAHLVLDPAVTLRVRVYAPVQWRISHLSESEGMTREAAEEEIRRVDEERRAFTQEHFTIDPNTPHQFDLMVNTSRFSVATAADLVVAAFVARYGAC